MNEIGFPPHVQPWPTDEKYDPELLANGDRRNVLTKYRYWKVEAIKADLDLNRVTLEVAVENLTRDFNMGTIIRNANAFNVRTIHVVGKHQWNKRGAMATDKYMNIEYHDTVADFAKSMKDKNKSIIALDIIENAEPLGQTQLPENAVLVFGAEGEGISAELLNAADKVLYIEQFGSTRSVNVGVASGIAMYAWIQQHRLAS